MWRTDLQPSANRQRWRVGCAPLSSPASRSVITLFSRSDAMSPTPQLDQRRPAHPIEPIAMRVPEACRYVGISRSTLYVLISQGEIEKIGRASCRERVCQDG